MSYSPFQKEPKKRLPLWLHWWYQLPVSEQDRIFSLTPLIALSVFIGFVLLSYLYLSKQQYDHEKINTQQSVITIEQQMRLLFMENEEKLHDIAKDTSQSHNPEVMFLSQANHFMASHPEVASVYWYHIPTKQTYVYPLLSGQEKIPELLQSVKILNDPKVSSKPVDGNYQRLKFSYSSPFIKEGNRAWMYASTALPNKENPEYIITAAYDLERTLRKVAPVEASLYTTIWLQKNDGRILASTSPMTDHQQYNDSDHIPPSSITIDRFRNEISIYAQSTRLRNTLTGGFLFWFTVGLSIFTCSLFILNWRHIHQLVNAQNATQRESNFRRAVEDSITTGLQGFDLEQRINYVNPAFCQMLGYTEEELLGTKAPFPYWSGDITQYFERSTKRSNTNLHTGIEAKLNRKNGERFHAMFYISPLIDETGEQSGWIIAVNDISEYKRSKEELALAGQRFTTVLEGMDAAISVSAVGSKTLLFSNNAYRTIFGDAEEIHATLITQLKRVQPQPTPAVFNHNSSLAADPNNKNATDLSNKTQLIFYLESHGLWVEVHSQYLPWVDGRLAQMLVTTDVTERQKTEEQAAIQAEQAETASRLITMGEMASSVAHELNQPLTAIHNYCSGLVRRLQNGNLSQDELLIALEKTAKQADRAGKITQRIRSFVRKNTPKRVLTSISEMIENIYDFIEIDARRRQVKVSIHIEENLPLIYLDPILIEQVLLNLTRNATEAIDDAKRPLDQRRIKVEIKRFTDEDHIEKIKFKVKDTGPGMPEEVMEHLFEAFFTTKANGLGIGLNLCRSIVESHSGRLYFYNIYNNDTVTGCCFVFTIPLHWKDPKTSS